MIVAGCLLAFLLQTRHIRAQVPLPELPPAPRVELSDDRATIDSIGLSVPLPVGARTFELAAGDLSNTRIELPDQLGTVVLEAQRVGDRRREVQEIESALIKAALSIQVPGLVDPEQSLVTPLGRIRAPGPQIRLQDGLIRPVYLTLESPGPNAPELGQGIAVFPVSRDVAGKTFLIARLFTLDSQLTSARAHFETMLAGLTINLSAAIGERAAAAEAGIAFLAQITPEDLDAFARTRTDLFERLYAPGEQAGEVNERGYRRTRIKAGVRGEVSGNARNPTGSDADPGYVVEIDARLLLGETAAEGLIDSRAIYFVARDDQSETWTVQNAIRRSGDRRARAEVWTEIGARDDTSMRVQIARTGTPAKTVAPRIQGEGYVSRGLSFYLPELLASRSQIGSFAFYSYDQNAEAIRLRTFNVEPVEPGTLDSGFRVTISDPDGRAQITTIDRNGRPARTTLDTGLIWEPIDPQALFDLWRRKGLPVD